MSLSVPEHIVWSPGDGASVLFDSIAGTYFGLNDTGSAVWQLLAKGIPLPEIGARLAHEFDVDERAAGAEARRIADQLISAGLLIETPFAGEADRP
jgi:hypothetical protein